MNDLKKQIQDWITAEEKAGRNVDINRINQFASLLARQHNNTPRNEFNGLTPMEIHGIICHPFTSHCAVKLNKLDKSQYHKIPLVRQTLFLLTSLNENGLKLTQRGWLPLKIVAGTYHLGQPEWVVEEYGAKRYFEYDVPSVWMARIIIEVLGWSKTRKGILSITVKGKKALANIDAAANEILQASLDKVGLQNFDAVRDDTIGNLGLAYSVWLINKYGSEWRTGNFYQEEYLKAFNLSSAYSVYETRVLKRLFYWLGIVEQRLNRQVRPPYQDEYRKTNLLPMIFSFNKE